MSKEQEGARRRAKTPQHVRSEGSSDSTRRPPRRLIAQLGVGAVMVLAGGLFATSARISGGGAIRDEAGDVADVLRQRERRITELEKRAARTREQIQDLTSRNGTPDTRQEQLVSEAVGLAAVHGPGLRVTLTDAPTGVLGTLPDVGPNDLVVHQQDLEAYVNALWAGGGEAMTLQGARIIATSAFRCAGNTLLFEGRVYSPPFVIEVIGDVDGMKASLDASAPVRVYRDWVNYVGLGESIESLPDVELPGYEGSLTLDTAKAG